MDHHISIDHRGLQTGTIQDIRLNLINVAPPTHLVEVAYIKTLGHKRRVHITAQTPTSSREENAIHA
jgi:hypothetical protein